MNDLWIALALGAYVFAAGGYVFTWHVYRLLTNHFEHRLARLEKRLGL